MSRLVIISGASGAGKSFLLQQLSKFENDIVSIKKKTTRGPRKNEPENTTLDLFLNRTHEEVSKCDYKYLYCENLYGISRQDIDIALSNNKTPVVIVADCAKINEMKQDYKTALVLYVQNILSGDDLRKHLLEYNDALDVDKRIERQKNSFQDYIKNIEEKIFDYVLINDFSEAFISQIQFIYDYEINKGINSNYIFVIMSFDKEYDEIYTALQVIGKAFKNIKIERIDERRGGDYLIVKKIEEHIEKAGLIICDVSKESPNVYYELGYARAKNKDILLMARAGTKLPFDSAPRRTIFYDSAIDMQTKIHEELREYYRDSKEGKKL